MPHESARMTNELETSLTHFDRLIRDRIDEIEPVDAAPAGVIIDPEDDDTEWIAYPDGRIEYCNFWQTRNLKIGGKEVVYAFREPTWFTDENIVDDEPSLVEPSAQLTVYQFEAGKIAVRTIFTSQEDEIYKTRVTDFDLYNERGFCDLVRPLSPIERGFILHAANKPAVYAEQLDYIAGLTLKEQEAVEEIRQAQDEQLEAESKEEMAQFAAFFPAPPIGKFVLPPSTLSRHIASGDCYTDEHC